MAHWFHRNPLKATAPVSFNFYGVAGSPAANKICKYVLSPLYKLSTIQILIWTDCHFTPNAVVVSTYFTKRRFLDPFSDLRTTRARLLEMFTDITCNPDIMKNVTDAYFSLLQGIITLLIIHSPFFYCLCLLDVLNYFCIKVVMQKQQFVSCNSNLNSDLYLNLLLYI